MIHVTHALPVNTDGQPELTVEQVWDGLVLKANDALPFVPAMTRCTVTARHSDTVFDRDVVFRGQSFTERITLLAPRRVVFTRIAGPVLGTIANEVEGPPEDLRLLAELFHRMVDDFVAHVDDWAVEAERDPGGVEE